MSSGFIADTPSVLTRPAFTLKEVSFASPENPVAIRCVLWLPMPALAFSVGVPEPCLVNSWITPPMASEPYRLLTLPRTTSMRSRLSSMMCSMAVVPSVAELMRTPSNSIST